MGHEGAASKLWMKELLHHLGNCQNYGPFLGPYFDTGPNLGDPKRDHNFDNPPPEIPYVGVLHLNTFWVPGF